MTEPTPSQTDPQPTRGFNRSSHIVILVVLIAAYFPALASPNRATFSPADVFFQLLLGSLYLVLATFGESYFEERVAPRYHLLYFLIMMPLTLFIFYVGESFSSGIWLLLLPVTAQTVTLPRWQIPLINIAYLAVLSLMLSLTGVTDETVFQFAFSIGAAMVFTLVFTDLAVREQVARKEVQRLADELGAANDKLRAYSVQVEELATSRERYRLAREIHDSVGHFLTAVNMQLTAALAVFERDPDKARTAISRAQGLTQEGLSEIRRSVAALRESPLGERPLPDAIELLAAESRAAGIVTRLQVAGEPRALEPKIELTLYRAAQEGLTNARKHAGASRIDLLLDYGAPESIVLTVTDNGVGAEMSHGAPVDGAGFGLLGLRERVQMLHGQLSCDTAPGAGFTLTVTLPAPSQIGPISKIGPI